MFLKEKGIRGTASLCTCCFGSLDFSCIQQKCICTEQGQAFTKQQANNHSHDVASVSYFKVIRGDFTHMGSGKHLEHRHLEDSVQGQPGLHSKTISQNRHTNKRPQNKTK